MAQITYLTERLDRLTPYLSDELVARIVDHPEDARIAPENRPVTVMFANYKGIARLIEKMGDSDPELITHHLNNYFVHMASIVERYEGTLARMDQYAVGDRLVIFFGAPRAHEDDPVRAVTTALEMQKAAREELRALRTATGVYRFEQRIGINTGFLFAGNAGAHRSAPGIHPDGRRYQHGRPPDVQRHLGRISISASAPKNRSKPTSIWKTWAKSRSKAKKSASQPSKCWASAARWAAHAALMRASRP